MTIWSKSKGIMARQKLIESCLGQSLVRYSANAATQSDDKMAGWGLKKNSRKIKQQAVKLNIPYLHLEDGLIGYIGHPAKKGHAVSLIADDLGIYYDARQPSRVEQLISQPVDNELLKRAELLMSEIVNHGITKYNCYANTALPEALEHRFSDHSQSCILLVDQVAGDLSVTGAMAIEADFVTMVKQAKANHPTARLLLRTHPDTRLGNKKGILAKLNLPELEVVSEACHPHALIKQVDAVYTVSSQMGFEALLLNKPVYCFGMPFYAGWGLTNDIKTCSRRSAVSLPQLVAAALIRYPRYYNPVLGKRCEVEEAIALIVQQYQPAVDNNQQYKSLYLVGFSLWKRAFMQRFCGHLAVRLKFVNKPPPKLQSNEQVLVWGAKYPELNNVIRVEDGFIRSNGLGSNLCRPSSLSIDPLGIYFDSRSPSQLEQLLNNNELGKAELKRGQTLIASLKSNGVSKYNVGTTAVFKPPVTTKPIILVVGQVDGDASILTGSAQIRSNEALLWAVREARPDAYIIYKPHPDVVAGYRGGVISEACQAQCVNSQVVGLSLPGLFPHIAEMHTMTSLSGFEALVQGVSVVTWGQPFYAGWGLTQDMNPPARRERKLDLATLVFHTLVSYPRYLDWSTGLWAGPEQIIELMARQNKSEEVAASFVQRWWTKAKYLSQTLKSVS